MKNLLSLIVVLALSATILSCGNTSTATSPKADSVVVKVDTAHAVAKADTTKAVTAPTGATGTTVNVGVVKK